MADRSRSCIRAFRSTAALLYLLVSRQKLPHTRHDPLLRVDTIEKLRSVQRITGEEALVEDLPAPEGAAGDIPGQAEELHTLAGTGCVGGQILFDLRLQGTG